MHFLQKLKILALLILVVICTWFSPLDLPATERVDEGLKRALISFASARTLNAVISMAQGTETAVQPFGVGINLAPGQLLDPINDLVENFSDLMLAASVAFGIQKLLISVGSYWPVSLLLTVLSLSWALLYIRSRPIPSWLSKVLLILLMSRFAIPLVILGTDLIFEKFMAAEYTENQQRIDNASAVIEEIKTSDNQVSSSQIQNTAIPKEHGVFNSIRSKLNEASDAIVDKSASTLAKAKSAVDIEAHFKNIQNKTEQWVVHIINLIVIFLLQTLIIPLLLLWIFYVFVKELLKTPASNI
jgi:hypothetical protein